MYLATEGYAGTVLSISATGAEDDALFTFIGAGSVLISSVTFVLSESCRLQHLDVAVTYRAVVNQRNIHHRLKDTVFDLFVIVQLLNFLEEGCVQFLGLVRSSRSMEIRLGTFLRRSQECKLRYCWISRAAFSNDYFRVLTAEYFALDVGNTVFPPTTLFVIP